MILTSSATKSRSVSLVTDTLYMYISTPVLTVMNIWFVKNVMSWNLKRLFITEFKMDIRSEKYTWWQFFVQTPTQPQLNLTLSWVRIENSAYNLGPKSIFSSDFVLFSLEMVFFHFWQYCRCIVLIVQIAIVITSPRPPSCFTLVEASLKKTQKFGTMTKKGREGEDKLFSISFWEFWKPRGGLNFSKISEMKIALNHRPK